MSPTNQSKRVEILSDKNKKIITDFYDKIYYQNGSYLVESHQNKNKRYTVLNKKGEIVIKSYLPIIFFSSKASISYDSINKRFYLLENNKKTLIKNLSDKNIFGNFYPSFNSDLHLIYFTDTYTYSYLDKKDKVDLSSILSKTYTKTNLNNVIDFTKDSLDMKFATSSVTRRNSKLAKENFISRGFNLNKDNYLFDAMLSPSRPAKAVVGKAPTLLTSKRFAKYSSITKKESLLTSQEYWDLMSFPKNKYQLVKPEILDNQIYKICGNSVLVCVIEEILKLNKNIK